VTEQVRAIESLAFDAWGAAEVEGLGGWKLRFNSGVTNRANSVWTCGRPDDLPLEEKLARVEAFYRVRGQPALLQVCAASTPPSLDRALEGRAYELVFPVQVQTAGLDAVAAQAGPDDVVTTCSETLSEVWFELSGHRGRFSGEEIPVYRALLQRAVGTPCFALARLGTEPVGVGFGVVQGESVGVFAMLTLDEHRGRGIGRNVVAAIARFALERGAVNGYLQVERGNPAALALYRRTGFETAYEYHYRRRAG